MQILVKKLNKEKAILLKWIHLALLILLISLSHGEVIQINDDYVAMTTENLRVFVQDSEELRILKEGKKVNGRRYQLYIGANAGTYGAGLNAGIIF